MRAEKAFASASLQDDISEYIESKGTTSSVLNIADGLGR
jgi:hypothetical protein